MTFSATTYTAPSGAFSSTAGYRVGEDAAGSFHTVYNPGVLEKYRGGYQTAQVIELGSDEWSKAIQKYSTLVTPADFDAYGGKLVELTQNLISFSPHCSLGPLRGAAKPCVTAEVLSRGGLEYEYFNFQEGSKTENRPRIVQDLSTILLERDPGEHVYRINITDTARGGQGINTLVDMLAQVKDSKSEFEHQQWILDLNLLHDTTGKTHVGNIMAVQGKRRPGSFEIQLHRYVVPNLIVEDFDPALAFSLEWDGKRHIFKPCSVPGKFLYQVGNEIRLVEADNCYLTFEEHYSQAITEYLKTSPEYDQVGVVWQEYQEKG